VDYAREVQPLLAEHCFHCHGQDEYSRKGKLRLDVRDAALKGGKSEGPAIAPGQPDKSSLLARLLTHEEDEDHAAARGEKAREQQADVAKLRQWIQEGAAYAGHWAFVAPVKKPLPATASHPVDAFILERLKREGLGMASAAAPETLSRRLHLDLTGLPPTPAEVDAFVAEAKATGLAAAVNAKVEALMKDRRFGEKWARHWLDVARYADSNGFEKDLPRDQWIWREWVIDALNRDLPYDQFIVEQLAGVFVAQGFEAADHCHRFPGAMA